MKAGPLRSTIPLDLDWLETRLEEQFLDFPWQRLTPQRANLTGQPFEGLSVPDFLMPRLRGSGYFLQLKLNIFKQVCHARFFPRPTSRGRPQGFITSRP